jgi:hypothetical protein
MHAHACNSVLWVICRTHMCITPFGLLQAHRSAMEADIATLMLDFEPVLRRLFAAYCERCAGYSALLSRDVAARAAHERLTFAQKQVHVPTQYTYTMYLLYRLLLSLVGYL